MSRHLEWLRVVVARKAAEAAEAAQYARESAEALVAWQDPDPVLERFRRSSARTAAERAAYLRALATDLVSELALTEVNDMADGPDEQDVPE